MKKQAMTVEQIAQIPGDTLVLRYWVWDGEENPEPEVWRRSSAPKSWNDEHWYMLDDPEYGQKDEGFRSEHCLYAILWQPES